MLQVSFSYSFYMFFCSFQNLFIGVIGEYISKIYLETKHSPKYITEEIIRKFCL